MDGIVPLVENVVGTTYERIPLEARTIAKRTVIDTLGAIVAGSTVPTCQVVVDMVRQWAGREESTVLMSGARVPAHHAAWANAAMGRSREIDDCDEATGDHSSVISVSTALAMAELCGATGKDVLTAIVLGVDTVMRIRDATKTRAGVSPWGTASYAVFNSATVAGKLLGLNEDKMVNALGMAFSQMANTHQWIVDRALSGPVMHGLAGSGGLLSALLAAKGITGPRNVLEGKYGLYPVYESNRYDRDLTFGNLGKEFRITRLSVKPFACCKQTHGPIQGTLELVKQHNLRPQDVREITVHVNQSAYSLCGTPDRKTKPPQTIPEAQFNIYYAVGAAVVYRDAFLARFTEQAIKDREVWKMAGRVNIVVEPELAAVTASVAPTIVDISTRQGKTYSTRVDYVLGHPKNPMSFDDCVEKFRKCTAFASKPLPKESVEEVIAMVRDLENVTDVAGIARHLA